MNYYSIQVFTDTQFQFAPQEYTHLHPMWYIWTVRFLWWFSHYITLFNKIIRYVARMLSYNISLLSHKISKFNFTLVSFLRLLCILTNTFSQFWTDAFAFLHFHYSFFAFFESISNSHDLSYYKKLALSLVKIFTMS